MDHTTLRLIIYSFFILLASFGGASILLMANWKRSTIRLFISFGAGVLLGAAFLNMIPEAAYLIGEHIGIPLLLGFLTLFIFEKFIMVHACEAEDCAYHQIGLSALIGISLHALVTGIALGAGLIAPQLSLVVFLAVLMHKFPESFSLASILAHEHYSRQKIIASVLLIALLVPLGAVFVLLFFESVREEVLGWLLAFSAGTFVHIAADDLLPEVHSSALKRKTSLSIFLVGVFFMWLSHELLA